MQQRLKTLISICFLLLSIINLNSCKSKDSFGNEVNPIKAGYQNLTAHYNIYFNADLIFEQTVNDFEDAYPVVFTEIMPVIKLPDEAATQAMSANMDKVIEKCTKIVSRKRASQWTDEAYTMIGKAFFYKGDYYNASRTFQFIYNSYPREKDLKALSVAWTGLSKMQNKVLRHNDNIKDLTLASLPDADKSKLFVLEALSQFHIQQEEYKEAIQYLERTLPILKKNEDSINSNKEDKERKKYRIKRKNQHYQYNTFVLGQLYERVENYNKAIQAFEKTKRLQLSYDFQLATEINITRLKNITEGGTTRDLANKMRAFLAQPQNEKYRDQIYFVMGAIAERGGKIDSALAFYESSIRLGDENPTQKGITYTHMADIHYDNKNYLVAGKYYDSVLVSTQRITKDSERVKNRSIQIGLLARNLEIIRAQDSLQRVAKLSETEQDSILNQEVAKITTAIETDAQLAAEAEKQATEAEKDPVSMSSTQAGQLASRFKTDRSQSSSNWYFYNQMATAAGGNDFKKRWGNRELRDNWRISSKANGAITSVSGPSNQDILAQSNPGIDFSKIDAKQPGEIKEMLRENIPNTRAKLDSSNNRLQVAVLATADIYDVELNEPYIAIDYYERSLDIMASFDRSDAIFYNLNRLYTKTNQKNKADYSKGLLIGGYPYSNFTKALLAEDARKISDDYDKEEKAKEDKINKLYENTYQNFIYGHYKDVIFTADNFIQGSNDGEMMAKFSLLAAISEGMSGTYESFYSRLKYTANTFEKFESGKEAKRLLEEIALNKDEYIAREKPLEAFDMSRFDAKARINEQQRILQKEKEELARRLAEEEARSYFKQADSASVWQVVMAIKKSKYKLNNVRFNINQFNKQNYPKNKLSLTTKMIGDGTQVLSIKTFSSLSSALDYWKEITEQRAYLFEITGLVDANYDIFVITDSNYDKLLNQSNVEEYKNYFRLKIRKL